MSWLRKFILPSCILAVLAFSDIGEDFNDPGWPGLEKWLAAPFLSIRSNSMTWLMVHLSLFGSQPVLIALVVFSCLYRRLTPRLKDKLVFASASLLTSLLNLGLKAWFIRPRPGPESMPLSEEPYFSFPSGHAMISTVVYGFLAYLLWRLRPSPWVLLALPLIIAICLSRIYLAAHYPGDVLAGLVAGWPCLCLAVYLHQRSDRA